MIPDDLAHWEALIASGQDLAAVESLALISQVRVLWAVIGQQAGWLNEVTVERDALKLRVAELEKAN